MLSRNLLLNIAIVRRNVLPIIQKSMIISHKFDYRPLSTAPQHSNERIKRELPPPIIIADNAIKRMKEIIKGKESEYIGVKIGVKRRGCNGYSYTMNYATSEDKDSGKFEIIKQENLMILLDKKAIFFVVGTVMDYEETELSSEFTFNNPNAKGSCGCGESFNV